MVLTGGRSCCGVAPVTRHITLVASNWPIRFIYDSFTSQAWTRAGAGKKLSGVTLSSETAGADGVVMNFGIFGVPAEAIEGRL
jgi:hypothetical protein